MWLLLLDVVVVVGCGGCWMLWLLGWLWVCCRFLSVAVRLWLLLFSFFYCGCGYCCMSFFRCCCLCHRLNHHHHHHHCIQTSSPYCSNEALSVVSDMKNDQTTDQEALQTSLGVWWLYVVVGRLLLTLSNIV